MKINLAQNHSQNHLEIHPILLRRELLIPQFPLKGWN